MSMEITARLITNAGEGVGAGGLQSAAVKFGDMKVVFDVTLVCVSVLTGLLLLDIWKACGKAP